MILFKKPVVFAPEPLGEKDVLLAGGKIVAIADTIPEHQLGVEVEVISAGGLNMVPGLIDCHVHIAGAGGEGGPATRTPELQLSQMIEGGVTTVVGCLGTDSMTRSLESLLMKAKSLRAEGVSAWIFTGAYRVPPLTLLGDVGRDIALIDEIIGVGEVSISDHRSSGPSVEELIRLAEHSRVGGLLGGKGGIVNFHMGDAKEPFTILQQVVQRSELQLTQFLPTHCNRNAWIFEDAKTYGQQGYVDLTASSYPYFPDEEVKASKAIVELLAAGVPIEHITMSSDGGGSLPGFDEAGNLTRLEIGLPRSILVELGDAVIKEHLPLEQAITVATTNPADILRLPGKGRVAVGADADVLLLDAEFRVYHLVANGELMVKDGRPITQGTFEAP